MVNVQIELLDGVHLIEWLYCTLSHIQKKTDRRYLGLVLCLQEPTFDPLLS